MKKILSLLVASFFVWPSFSMAENDGLRPSLVRFSRDFLSEKITAEELLKQAQQERQERSFNEEEKSYLQDLTERLPPHLRQEFCPDLREGLCAEERSNTFTTWQEVPTPDKNNAAMETALPESTWWSQNSKWILTAAVGGFAWGVWSLRDKEIQFSPSR